MSAALHWTSRFLRTFGNRFYEARMARARQVVEEHRRFYRPETLQ
jgi:hypothetical protein